MKKLICLILFLNLSPALASSHPYTGFFLGAAVGGTNAQFDLKQDISLLIPKTIDPFIPSNILLYDNSFAGMVSAGYSYQFDNHFVLGLAATAGYTHIDQSEHVLFEVVGNANFALTSDLNIELTNDFSLLAKPGYAFKKTLIYGLIGPRWGNFQTSLKSNFTLVAGPTDLITSNGTDNTSQYELGLTVGAGIQQVFDERFTVGLEYAYTSYGKIESPHTFSYVSDNGIPFTDTSFENNPSIDASTNTLMLTFAYRC